MAKRVKAELRPDWMMLFADGVATDTIKASHETCGDFTQNGVWYTWQPVRITTADAPDYKAVVEGLGEWLVKEHRAALRNEVQCNPAFTIDLVLAKITRLTRKATKGTK